ncbi:MAG: hypothetical protein O3A78_05240 [Nitrospinae bacterium]|jgi:hypothetical protein|nr:hypothetical protein [Nitrospinota bacterium]MDA1109208.1 hypothetical protein [Nitrospinota bacterium]
MDFSIVRSTQISKVYQNQNRIAELNQKYPFKSAQGQVDRVSISSTAERLLQENQDAQTAPVPKSQLRLKRANPKPLTTPRNLSRMGPD